VTAVTDLVTTGPDVFTNRMTPFRDSDLPNISVYVAREAETIEEDDEMGPYELRVLPVDIVARARANNELDDQLDDICLEVETAIHADTDLAALIKGISLISTEIEMDHEGEQPVGAARMEWAIIYRVNGAAPTAPVQ